MPKVEGKADLMQEDEGGYQQGAGSRGLRSWATYVEKDLKVALDKSISSQWSWD